MCSDVRVHRRVTTTDVLHGLWAVPIAWLLASSVAAAQENPNPAASTTSLPEIRVIATTPVAPPRTPLLLQPHPRRLPRPLPLPLLRLLQLLCLVRWNL